MIVTIRIGRVGNNDIVLVDLVLQELETVANVDLDLGVLETNGHVGEVFLGNARDSFVNVNKSSFLDTFVLDDLAENTSVTTTDHKHLKERLSISVFN